MIGFNADGSFYQNHYLSMLSNAKDVACLQTEWTNIVYQLGKLYS